MQLLDALDPFVDTPYVGRQIGSAGVGSIAGFAPVRFLARVNIHVVVQGSLVVKTPNWGADRAKVRLLKNKNVFKNVDNEKFNFERLLHS